MSFENMLGSNAFAWRGMYAIGFFINVNKAYRAYFLKQPSWHKLLFLVMP